MLNLIYSELLKLKGTFIMPIVLIGGTIMTITMFIARLITEHDMTFEKYAYNIEQMNFLILYIVLFSIMAAYVFSREFTDKTANILYVYPVSKIKIFISKLITIYILISLTYLIESISIPLSYYFLNGIFPEWNLIIRDIKANAYSLLFQFLLIPIPVLIANISKNITMPIIYGILAFISSNFLANDDLGHFKYIPLATPYLSAAYFYFPKDINFNYIIISGILCFTLFISICIYEFNKKDID